jgi:peptide/nickel transport system permease protein
MIQRDLPGDANGQILRNAPPSAEHWMGTDSIGRDIFSRLLYAGRISLSIALIVTFATIIGVLVGLFPGIMAALSTISSNVS